MVDRNGHCESCDADGVRTSVTRYPDGSRYEMCDSCGRQWMLIWRHWCEWQPRQANRVRAKANQARTDGGGR